MRKRDRVKMLGTIARNAITEMAEVMEGMDSFESEGSDAEGKAVMLDWILGIREELDKFMAVRLHLTSAEKEEEKKRCAELPY